MVHILKRSTWLLRYERNVGLSRDSINKEAPAVVQARNISGLDQDSDSRERNQGRKKEDLVIKKRPVSFGLSIRVSRGTIYWEAGNKSENSFFFGGDELDWGKTKILSLNTEGRICQEVINVFFRAQRQTAAWERMPSKQEFWVCFVVLMPHLKQCLKPHLASSRGLINICCVNKWMVTKMVPKVITWYEIREELQTEVLR